MRFRYLVGLLAACLALSFFAPSFLYACPTDFASGCIYVASSTGRQVIAVSRADGQQRVVFTFPTGQFPEDVTVGPDTFIYVSLPATGQIVRINANVAPATAQVVYRAGAGKSPRGLRFNSTGDLYFATTDGILRIGAAAFTSLPASASLAVAFASSGISGLAFSPDGHLYFAETSSGRVFRSVWSAPTPTFAQPVDLQVPGLLNPVGLAVNSLGHLLVADRATGKITRCKFKGLEPGDKVCSTLATFALPNRPAYLELVPNEAVTSVDKDQYPNWNWLDEFVWVGTADSSLANGKVWKVYSPALAAATESSPQLLAVLPRIQGKFPPAVGVSPTPVSRSLSIAFDSSFPAPENTTRVVNFGTYGFEVSNDVVGSCTLQVRQAQTPLSSAELELIRTKLQAEGFSVRRFIPFYGQRGFVTGFEVTPQCSAGSSFAPQSGVYISGFYGTTWFVPQTNTIQALVPRLVKVEKTGTSSVVTLLPSLGYYPIGPAIEDMPNDPGTRAGSIGFSTFYLADLELLQNGNFCGFSAPLRNAPTVEDAGLNVFNEGQDITFKFQLSTGPNCTGSLITDARAVLSVAHVPPDFSRKEVSPSGNSVLEPPVFRLSGGQYVFTAKSTGWGKGTFAATVIADKFSPQTIYFQIK